MSLIIYVEDDAVLQLEGRYALNDAGYEVMVANDGQEACNCLEFRSGEVASLITDVGLPGDLDGWDVAERARLIQPQMPVIYLTATDSAQFACRGVIGSRLVPKPFSWTEVLRFLAGSGPNPVQRPG